jgi:GPH family glycoside/pentoside/hexuronide:cation symporter
VTQTLNRRQAVFYAMGSIGTGVYNGFNNAVLSLFVASLTNSPFIQGYLGNTRTIEGVIIQPLVGRWSDRTTSPLGRRRPFILAYVPVSVLFLLLIPFLRSTDHSLALPLIAAAIILFSITWNIASDPYGALMVDITPETQRSRFNAILSIVSLLGQIGIVSFASIAALRKNNIPNSVFWLTGAILLVSFSFVFCGVRESEHAGQAARQEAVVPFRTYIDDLRRFTEALKLLISVFFLWTGLNAILPFLTIFPVKIVHASDTQAFVTYMVIVLFTAIWAYPWGWLAARYGHRPMIALGTVLLIAAALLGLVVPSYIWLFPLAALAGTGFSATTVLTFPYLSILVPDSKIGVFTGLQTAFSAVAVPISVALTGALIDRFGYRSIFAVQVVMMAIDIAILWRVDEVKARQQVEFITRMERELLNATGSPAAAPFDISQGCD